MGLAKLTSAHIALITAVSVVLIGVTFFFLGPYKTNQNLKALSDRKSTAETELAKTMVSPHETMTAPSASLAILPVSIEI